jgi:hypothetical protein
MLTLVEALNYRCLRDISRPLDRFHAKDETGATDIVSGEEHPRLADWQHQVPLGDLFAAGVLG